MVMFLSETWLDNEQMVCIKERIDFDGLFIVSNDGQGSGLTLLWKASANSWVDSFSKYHIDSIVNGGSENA